MNTTSTPPTTTSPVLHVLWLALGVYEPGSYGSEIGLALVQMTPQAAARYLKMIELARDIAGHTGFVATFDEIAYFDDNAIFVDPDQTVRVQRFVEAAQRPLVNSMSVAALKKVSNHIVDKIKEARLVVRRVHVELDAIRWSAVWEADDVPVYTAYVTDKDLESIARGVVPQSLGR